MTNEEKFNLITRHVEEILTPEDLKNLIVKDAPLKHYIGFEISGRIHLGNGLATMLVVKDLLEAGAECTIFLADWHTWINEKLDGKMETIKRVAVGYFKEGMAISLRCLGADPGKIRFLLGSDLYRDHHDYWSTVVEIAKNTTLSRILRSMDIMGREAKGNVDFAKLFYPPMQVADIFIQDLNLAQGGMDQRKAHVIMREVALALKIHPVRTNGQPIKPVALHNHLILGLGKPPVWPLPKERLREIWTALKMSKSKPQTCIFIHDSPETILEKINAAFCPPQETEFNPVLDWAKNLLFSCRSSLTLKRDPIHGGKIAFESYDELKEAYASGILHPQDLKRGVGEYLIEILEPARRHFAHGEPKKMLTGLEKLTSP